MEEGYKIKVNHIGFLTQDMEVSIEYFMKLGGILLNRVLDETWDVELALVKINHFVIELVKPTSNSSPVFKLSRRGPSFYHVCFEVDDIKRSIDLFTMMGFIIVDHPKPAKLFQNRLVAFLYSKGTGLIELLEEERKDENSDCE